MSAVLWDIDGTLVASAGVAANAFLDAVGEVAGRRPIGRGLDLGGRIDPEIAVALLESIHAPVSLVPQVIARLGELAAARSQQFTDSVKSLAGVQEALATLATAGVAQTVVTGNIESVAMLKLEAAGLIPPIEPAHGGFGDSGTTRVEVATSALDKLSAATDIGTADQQWIVGDTPRDLACAQALGLRCALVATGRHSFDKLSALPGADLVVRSLIDADELWSAWGV